MIITQNKRLFAIVSAIALILCIPLVAMQFTHEVRWTLIDFVVAGALLLGAGLLLELILRKVPTVYLKIALCIFLAVALLLTWLELAVGIFGTPFAGS